MPFRAATEFASRQGLGCCFVSFAAMVQSPALLRFQVSANGDDAQRNAAVAIGAATAR